MKFQVAVSRKIVKVMFDSEAEINILLYLMILKLELRGWILPQMATHAFSNHVSHHPKESGSRDRAVAICAQRLCRMPAYASPKSNSRPGSAKERTDAGGGRLAKTEDQVQPNPR